MSKKVKVLLLSEVEQLMSRLAKNFLDEVSKDTDPCRPIDLYSERAKTKANLCISLGQNIGIKAIEIEEGALNASK